MLCVHGADTSCAGALLCEAQVGEHRSWTLPSGWPTADFWPGQQQAVNQANSKLSTRAALHDVRSAGHIPALIQGCVRVKACKAMGVQRFGPGSRAALDRDGSVVLSPEAEQL